MKVQGRVINDRNEYLPRATVTVVDATGKNLGVGAYADDDGMFIIDSPLIDGNKLLVTAADHLPVTRDPAPIMVFELPVKSMDEVVVTPGMKTGILWLIAGIVIYKML